MVVVSSPLTLSYDADCTLKTGVDKLISNSELFSVFDEVTIPVK